MPVPTGRQFAGFAGDLTSSGDPHPKNNWLDNAKDFKALNGVFTPLMDRKPKKKTDKPGMDGDSSGDGGS